MSRHSVDVSGSGMMIIEKKVRKDLNGGHLGLRQIRKTKNTVKNARLLRIMGCMAGQLGGKHYGSLGAIQEAFTKARAACRI